ncbi:MAG: molecular chaperone TorD family protein [Steroidobacteraceae bacterium]
MNAALDNATPDADAKLVAMARAEMYAGLSRLFASPEQAIATAWLDHVTIIERLLMADEALSTEGNRIAELFTLSQTADLEESAESTAASIGASYGALFEVGDRGPPLAIREELAPGANAAAKEEVARFYEHFGYRLGDDYAWRPDHLSVLLEFMHFLTWHESQSTDTALVQGLRAAQRDFCQRHLAWWVGDLADLVGSRDDAHPLLQASLRATKDFIAVELQSLGD